MDIINHSPISPQSNNIYGDVLKNLPHFVIKYIQTKRGGDETAGSRKRSSRHGQNSKSCVFGTHFSRKKIFDSKIDHYWKNKGKNTESVEKTISG